MAPVTINVHPYLLEFKEPAGTSRGVYRTRPVWYVSVTDSDGRTGWGECAPLPDLSAERGPDFEARLNEKLDIARTGVAPESHHFDDFSSVRFALECAYRDLESQKGVLWDSPFAQGEAGIVTNGLIWMGDRDTMAQRIDAKLEAGFSCLKLKIGAIDFEDELALLKLIRDRYSPETLTVRVDANGAFSLEDVHEKLERLAHFQLHSIEQPIRAGQLDAMGALCKTTPIPIALDEELIGIKTDAERKDVIDAIRPQFVILKPSLHGGFAGSAAWIREAQRVGADYWVTSALESNLGLAAISQWCATLDTVTKRNLPQGLGTGALFRNNVDSPLVMRGERLWWAPESWTGFSIKDQAKMSSLS